MWNFPLSARVQFDSAPGNKLLITKTMEKKIYTAMAAANKAITAIAKGRINQQQQFAFRGIDDVYNDLHAILAENEIFIITEVVSYTVDEKTTARGGILYYTRATIKHHFTTTDGSEVVTTTVGEAMDSGDKGMNKAMSVALKYALMQAFTIPTDEKKDPDADTHETVAPVIDPIERAAYLMESKDLEELRARYKELPKHIQQDRAVMDAIQKLQQKFSA